MSQFSLSDDNPNVTTGGGGCLCHPRGGDETRGPYLIFTPTTTDDNLTPHAVLCAHCACAAADRVNEPEPEEVIDLSEDDFFEEAATEPKTVTI